MPPSCIVMDRPELHVTHTSILRHVFLYIVPSRVIPGVVQSSLLGLPLLLFPCTRMFNIFLVLSSPSFPQLVVIPSQSSLSEQGRHWFYVGLSPDVLVFYVVLLCLASRPLHCIAFSSPWCVVFVRRFS